MDLSLGRFTTTREELTDIIRHFLKENNIPVDVQVTGEFLKVYAKTTLLGFEVSSMSLDFSATIEDGNLVLTLRSFSGIFFRALKELLWKFLLEQTKHFSCITWNDKIYEIHINTEKITEKEPVYVFPEFFDLSNNHIEFSLFYKTSDTIKENDEVEL